MFSGQIYAHFLIFFFNDFPGFNIQLHIEIHRKHIFTKRIIGMFNLLIVIKRNKCTNHIAGNNNVINIVQMSNSFFQSVWPIKSIFWIVILLSFASDSPAKNEVMVNHNRTRLRFIRISKCVFPNYFACFIQRIKFWFIIVQWNFIEC